jgi:hypothetical protein
VTVVTALCLLLLALTPRASTAASDYPQQVQQMYIAYYGHPGDPAGVDYWAGRLAEVGGDWIADLVNAFGDSPEYTERFGALADETLIDNLFLGLFNRSVDRAGLDFYVDLLNGSNLSGFNPDLRQSTLAQIALDVANGAQPGSEDQQILANKLQAAAYFTAAIRAAGRDYAEADIATAVSLIADTGLSADTLATARARIIAFAGAAPVLYPINDTGITSCADGQNTGRDCPVDAYPGQDAQQGRDLSANDDSDGRAGFSFTKVDAAGNALSADAADWTCVRDNVTGLLWEVKTDDSGLRDRDATYTWHDADAPEDARGVADGGTCHASGRCDTERYVEDVNAAQLCGYADWRLPSPHELAGLVDYGLAAPPLIDTDYFPHTALGRFWTAAPYGSDPRLAIGVDLVNGYVSSDFMAGPESVRLVRGEQPTAAFLDHDDGTVTDINTGLMWAKCSEGQSGETCSSGEALTLTWADALARAESTTLGGYADWRLPSIKELLSLAVDTTGATAFDDAAFPSTPAMAFWSASPFSGSPYLAWYLYAGDGLVFSLNKTNAYAVRLVRDGQ